MVFVSEYNVWRKYSSGPHDCYQIDAMCNNKCYKFVRSSKDDDGDYTYQDPGK